MGVTTQVRQKAAPREHLMFSEHLTGASFDAPLRETYLGQAHIAGTGPEGKTCRECVFWHKWRYDKIRKEQVPCDPGYYGKKHATPLAIKKARCNRPILNKAKRVIPHDAKSCRLFEPSDNPPAPRAAK